MHVSGVYSVRTINETYDFLSLYIPSFFTHLCAHNCRLVIFLFHTSALISANEINHHSDEHRTKAARLYTGCAIKKRYYLVGRRHSEQPKIA